MTKNHEKINTTEHKSNKKSGWIKTTALAIMGLFTACDNIPSDQIILNIDEQSEKFNIEYQFSEGSAGATLIDYNIFVRKNGDKFEGKIEQSDGLFTNITNIESNNIDGLFDTISSKLDHDYITDNTRDKKDKKVAFAKQTYKDSVLNRTLPTKNEEIKVKYKSK